MRDILQGVSSLGVYVTSSFQVRIYMYFVKRGEIPLLSLNELREKSQATISFGKFVNKP